MCVKRKGAIWAICFTFGLYVALCTFAGGNECMCQCVIGLGKSQKPHVIAAENQRRVEIGLTTLYMCVYV